MKYLIIIEKSKTGFGAYSPDLQGCVATGKTRAEVVKLMRGAIKMHLEGMLVDGERPPRPTTTSVVIEVPPLTPLKELRLEYARFQRARGAAAARHTEGRRAQESVARKHP